MRVASVSGWLAGLFVFAWVSVAASAPTVTTLYGFCAKDNSRCGEGDRPSGALTLDASGNLYGAAQTGGNNRNEECQILEGCGTVFRFSTQDGSYRTLHKFCRRTCSDGAFPYGKLVLDTSGNLYGVTIAGGETDQGVVFKVTPEGKYTVLRHFCLETDCVDGANPAHLTYRGEDSGALYDGISPLYGTGFSGPNNAGVIFELRPGARKKWKYKILYAFNGATGSSTPNGLTFDAAGNFVGTAFAGNGASRFGSIFRFDGTTFETLYNFCSVANCTDGKSPGGKLVRDGAGNFYGTTSEGGANGSGVVYKLSSSGQYATIHDFCRIDDQDCKAGGGPAGDMVLDANGVLFGSANYLGNSGLGVIFKLRANGSYQVEHTFCETSDHFHCPEGASPGSLIMGGQGRFFGTTSAQGPGHYVQGDGGTIFEFVP